MLSSSNLSFGENQFIMASIEPNNGLNECFHYLSEDVHLFETIGMLSLSSVIVYLINLPILYKSLVLACRREFKSYNNSIKSIESILVVAQIIILGLLSYSRYKTHNIYSSISITTIASLIQIIIYFTNSVLGSLLAVILLGFISCGFAYDIFINDMILSSIITIIEALLVYIVAPSVFFVKFNYCFSRLALIPYSKYLGIWLFLQVYWSIFEGVAILTFSNLGTLLCPSKRIEGLLKDLPELLATVSWSYRIPMTVILMITGIIILHGYLHLEKLLKMVHMKYLEKSA